MKSRRPICALRVSIRAVAVTRHNLTSMPRDAISSFAWRTLYSP